MNSEIKKSGYFADAKRVRSCEPQIFTTSTTNPTVAERTLRAPLRTPYSLAPKRKAAALAASVSGTKSDVCTIWRCFLDEVRSYFSENPQGFED